MPEIPMTVGHPVPAFPGGMEVAPELTTHGCQHDACLCHVGVEARFCSLGCARDRSQDDVCGCGHYGCSYHRT
jgi:hypothetical protein